ERAGEAVEFVEGGVAGVAAGIIFRGPAATGVVEVAELAALGGEAVVEAREAGALKRLAINISGKPGANGHGASEREPGKKFNGKCADDPCGAEQRRDVATRLTRLLTCGAADASGVRRRARDRSKREPRGC